MSHKLNYTTFFLNCPQENHNKFKICDWGMGRKTIKNEKTGKLWGSGGGNMRIEAF